MAKTAVKIYKVQMTSKVSSVIYVAAADIETVANEYTTAYKITKISDTGYYLT